MKRFIIVLVFFMVSLTAFAETYKNKLHVFTGSFTSDSMGKTANFIESDYEDNYLLALAYSRHIGNLFFDIEYGPEVGFAARFGDKGTYEGWGGLFLRHKGITVGSLRIGVGITGGVSWVNETMGKERERTKNPHEDRDAYVLFYLGPEISFSLQKFPRWELVYRLHHRSGADGTVGNMNEAYNANTIGLRYSF